MSTLLEQPPVAGIEPLLRAKDMAAIFGLSDQESAYHLPIRKVKLGRAVRWRPADVRLYIDLNTEG